MGKVILITGSETLLGRKLIEKSLSAGYKVIAPILSNEEENNEARKNNLLVIPWNKSSIISTRTVIREGIRVFRKIDEAILVYTENKTNDQLLDFSTSDIDLTIDSSVKSLVYLTRELLKVQNNSPENAIAFAMTRKNRYIANTIERGFYGFFRSFADGMIQDDSAVFKCAFTTDMTDMENYSAFISSVLSERPLKAKGQWLGYSEKKSLFSSLPILVRKQEII